jgi:integrase
MRIATPYKHPNSGIYYFRRAVPNECRRILKRTIIKESLHTRDPNKARRLFAIKQGDCEKLFESARSGCINVNSNQHKVNDNKLVVGATLQELFDKFNKENNQSVKGMDEAQKVVNRFIGVHGSIAAEAISGVMIREFKELLINTPSILPEYFRTKSLRKIVSEIDGKYNGRTLSDSSINKHLSVLSSVLQWASDNSYFNDNWHNPVRGKTIRRKFSQRDRLPFTASDLDKIFSSDVYTNQLRPKGGAGEAAYWIPIIALYTGMRLEEIGQLLVSDIKCEDSIWYFDVNSFEDKKLKTKSSVRKVPIHHDLIKLEFITYINELECPRVFPLLKPDIYGRLTQNWSKWFGRRLPKLGINDDSKVFHSFRHLMKDALRNSGVDEAVSDAITGHSSSSIGRAYGKGYGLSMLNKAIQSIKYEGLTIERN